MRNLIVAVALLMLVGTAAMAAGNHVEISGVAQSYEQSSSSEGNIVNPVSGKVATQLDISANVDWWVYDSLDKSKVVFHFTNLGASDSVAALVEGHVDTTIAGWFSVLGDGSASCDLSKMSSGSNFIPVAWDVSKDGGHTWMGTTFVGNEVRAASTVQPGSYDYVWKITATAAQLQAYGTYTLDPTCSFVPSL